MFLFQTSSIANAEYFMDNRMDEKKRIIEQCTQELSVYEEIIQFFGTFGSLKHDIDMIVVLKPSKKDPINFNNLQKILSIFENFSEKIQIKSPFSVFPSFRVQTWVEHSSLPDSQPIYPRRHQSIHLLVYPDIDRLFQWERPFFIITLLESLNILSGSVDKLLEKCNSFKVPSFTQSLSYYMNLLYESYQLLLISQIPNQVLMTETFHHLNYILKFSSLEFLYSNNILPKPYYELSKIKECLKSFPEISTDLIDKLEIYDGNEILFSKDSLLLCYEDLTKFLNHLSKYKR